MGFEGGYRFGKVMPMMGFRIPLNGELKDAVTNELLPRAFVRPTRLNAMIDGVAQQILLGEQQEMVFPGIERRLHRDALAAHDRRYANNSDLRVNRTLPAPWNGEAMA